MANITYIRIDDEVYALHDDNALTSDSNLNASKVVGTLPASTYTDTTYESKAAVEGGTDISLVTTGDKYRWNNASGGGVSDVEVNGSSVVSGGVAEITVPTKTSDLTNDSNFQSATQVDAAINSKIASVYKAKGSVAFLDLPALTSSNEGFVYDVNESFTTTSDFVEGAGVTYPAGTNVVIIDTGSGVYKYDVLAGLVDLSGKQDTLVSGINIKTINGSSVLGSGNLSVGGGLQNLVDGSATGSVRGINTTAEDSQYTIGENAFAEGDDTTASGRSSHAEGAGTIASGTCSHAEGRGTTASANYSHAEGYYAAASGNHSHAEGYDAVASGNYSHAQNYHTIAAKEAQTAIGKYNIEDTETTANLQKAFIIGNGFYNNRSNALTVDWNGNVDIASGASYKINGTALSASDVGAQPTLVSGTNIKTINNQSLLGSGNITTPDTTYTAGIGIDITNNAISADVTDVEVDGTSVVNNGVAEIDLTGKQDNLTAGTLIDLTNNTVSVDSSTLLDIVYPVGKYVWTSETPSNFNPNTYWGGTWELMDEGITLVSAGQTYTIKSGTSADGGAAKVTLTTSQIPSHNHTVDFYYRNTVQYSSGSAARPYTKSGSESTTNWAETENTGGGKAHENMPPYKAAYCWHRIA